MTPRYSVAPARPQDIGALPAIELAAARLLEGHAPDSILNETTSDAVLDQAMQDGQLWVALADDVPVGFARVVPLDAEAAHLEEIDVHPDYARQGLGTALVLEVCRWAAAHAYTCVSLTTFRDVAWNRPWYARLGFDVVPDAELGPALMTIVEEETRRGLDPARRVVMRRWSHRRNISTTFGD